jgi:superfamily II DNA or RNA helicase
MPVAVQKKLYAKLGIKPPEKMMKMDTRGNVIIAMAQSLIRRTDANPIQVTLLIVDEVHKFSAPTFCKSIFNFSFRYSIGLTATDKRLDGLEWVFKDILGSDTIQLSGRRMNPRVILTSIRTGEPITLREHRMGWCVSDKRITTRYACRSRCGIEKSKSCTWSRFSENGKKMDFTGMLRRLSEDPVYNEGIVEIALRTYKAGRKVIIFSHFKAHLEYLRDAAIGAGVPASDTSLYFGGMDKDACTTPMLTFATYKVAKHGLDVPWKDCEILALPITEVEQVAGRSERLFQDKKQPVIIDIKAGSNPVFANQQRARIKYYESAGYDIDRL